MVPPGFEHKIMHASLRIGETQVMLSDGDSNTPASFKGFSLSLTAADAAQAESWFTALAKGGQVQMPLGKTFSLPVLGWWWIVLVWAGW